MHDPGLISIGILNKGQNALEIVFYAVSFFGMTLTEVPESGRWKGRREIFLTATVVSGCLCEAEIVNNSAVRCFVDLRLNLGDIGIPHRTGGVGDHALGQGQ